MVKINKKEKYRCPYCNNNYVTYEEADKCAQACVVLQYEKPYKTSQYNTYVCKFCNTEYRIKINAQQCEKNI